MEQELSLSQMASIELALLQNGIDLDAMQGDVLQLVIQAIQSREDQLVSGTNLLKLTAPSKLSLGL